MSAGIFKIFKKGYIELKFLQYNNSKMIRITPHVVKYSTTDKQPLYNLVFRRETLNKQAVLDFKSSTIAIDCIILPTQSLSTMCDPQYVMNVCRE